MTDGQLSEVVQLAYDFQMITGRLTKYTNENKYYCCSFLLFPMPIKRKHFEQAKFLQTKYQVRNFHPTIIVFFITFPLGLNFK